MLVAGGRTAAISPTQPGKSEWSSVMSRSTILRIMSPKPLGLMVPVFMKMDTKIQMRIMSEKMLKV